MRRARILLWAAAMATFAGWLLNLLRLLFSSEADAKLAGIIPTVFLVMLLELKNLKREQESVLRQWLRVTISSALGLLCLFSNVGFAQTHTARVVIPWALFAGTVVLAILIITESNRGSARASGPA